MVREMDCVTNESLLVQASGSGKAKTYEMSNAPYNKSIFTNIFSKNKKAQMKIQQMAFMVLAVFLFFILVGLFFLNFQLNNLRSGAQDLEREKAISSLEVITNMGELNCGGSRTLCIDEDKLRVMTGSLGNRLDDVWDVSSIKVYKVYPETQEFIECPGLHCNTYNLYDSKSSQVEEHSTYISLCKAIRQEGYRYERCEIAKLVVGVK